MSRIVPTMMNGLRRPIRVEVWSLIAATVGWTRIATRTPSVVMIASAVPFGATMPPRIGVGLPQTWSPPQTVSMIRIGSRLIPSAPHRMLIASQ